MTTPAVNTHEFVKADQAKQIQQWWHGGSLIHEIVIPIDCWKQRSWETRPESVSNPVRIDGTRAPSAWWCYRSSMTHTPRTFVEEWEEAGYVRRVISENVPATNVLLGGGAQAGLGMGWLWGYPEFPYSYEALAVTRALTKLRNQQYDFGTTLGELKESAQFVAQAAGDVVDFLSGLSNRLPGDRRDLVAFFMSLGSGDLRNARNRRYSKKVRESANVLWGRKAEKLMVSAINMWMAFQFAVKPLLYDINDASKALGEALWGEDPQPLRITVTSGSQGVDRHIAMLPGFQNAWKVRYGVDVETRVRINAVYDVVPTKASQLQQMGLTNSFAVGFELTTLSWMVDYLFNVGDWLATLTPVEGATFVEGTLTRFQQAWPGAAEEVIPDGDTLVQGSGRKTWSCNMMRIERELIPSYGLLPAFRPVFRNKLDLTRMANSLGALSNLVRKF